MTPAELLVSTHRHTGANVKHEVLTIFHKLKTQKTPMITLNIIGQRIAQKRKETWGYHQQIWWITVRAGTPRPSLWLYPVVYYIMSLSSDYENPKKGQTVPRIGL